MERDAQMGMVDDILTAFAGGRRPILALPMEMGIVDPMVVVSLIERLALFVQRDKQDLRLLFGQADMARVPIAGIETGAKQRGNSCASAAGISAAGKCNKLAQAQMPS